MISMEPDPPYMRPNLSKGLWKGRPVEKIWRKTEERGTELHLNRKVTELDPAKKLVRDSEGENTRTRSCCSQPAARPIICRLGTATLFIIAISRTTNICAR